MGDNQTSLGVFLALKTNSEPGHVSNAWKWLLLFKSEPNPNSIFLKRHVVSACLFNKDSNTGFSKKLIVALISTTDGY